MKRPEIQQILDWKLAKGLRFAQVYIAELAPCQANRVWRLRSRLGYCSPFTKTFTTLGQAVVMLALLRANDSPPKHSAPMIRALTAHLDDPNEPFPYFVAIDLAGDRYYMGNSGAEVFAQIERADTPMLLLIVPTLIEHLCNGDVTVYAERHGQAQTA